MKKKIVTKRDFSCGGLVWDPSIEKVLMVYVENLNGGKVWTFPKGHPEKGETDEQAAIREVREETGWDAVIKKPLMDVQYFYTHKKNRFDKVVRWFMMSPVRQAGAFQEEEILDCRWAGLNEAESLISYDSDKALLTKLKSVL